jgi:hypothetical protein
MGKPNAGSVDESFLAPAWQWGNELAGRLQLVTRVSLVPSRRPGVWVVTASAHEHVEGRISGTRCKVTVEWPTATLRPLAAEIMNLLMRLDHELGYDELNSHG